MALDPNKSNRGGLRNASAVLVPPVLRNAHLASVISSSSSVRRVAARAYQKVEVNKGKWKRTKNKGE